MINQPVYAKLRELTEALHDCGWSVARCEKFSEEMLERALSIDRSADRDRKAVEAARLLPTLGPDATAERIGVCRRSVYYLARAANEDSASLARATCTE